MVFWIAARCIIDTQIIINKKKKPDHPPSPTIHTHFSFLLYLLHKKKKKGTKISEQFLCRQINTDVLLLLAESNTDFSKMLFRPAALERVRKLPHSALPFTTQSSDTSLWLLKLYTKAKLNTVTLFFFLLFLFGNRWTYKNKIQLYKTRNKREKNHRRTKRVERTTYNTEKTRYYKSFW